MIERSLVVKARLGLHARAAAKLVRLVAGFQSTVVLRRSETDSGALRGPASNADADAKSILSVLMLAATCGTQLEARAEGADEEAAIAALEELFANGFGDEGSGNAK